MSQFLIAIDVSIVNVVLLPIQAEFEFSDVSLQWIVNAYNVLLAGFLLFGGRLADRVSRRGVMVAGFMLLSVASLVGGLAPMPFS